MSVQSSIAAETRMLNFADLFVDGCDVKFVQGAACNARAALPDRSLVDLTAIYRGRLQPSDFHFEYGPADCPAVAMLAGAKAR
jgi:hypothetical protein